MIDAGPTLHYQHYRPFGTLLSETPGLVAILAAQTLLVIVALARLIQSARGRAATGVPAVRIGIALAISMATAATLSPDPWRYVSELGLAAFIQILNVATIAVFVLSIPSTAATRIAGWVDRTIGGDAGDLPSPATPPAGPSSERPLPARPSSARLSFPAALAVVAGGLALVLSVTSYERHPHVPDEVVYLLHARYFAEGMLTMPAPPVPAAFDLDLMTYEPTRWFSPVPPGWPAVLAIGAWAGVPWIVNPILAGLAVLLAHALLVALYPRRIARWATMLLAVSPWFVFLGMSYMTQMMTLVTALVAALGVERARRTGSIAWSLVAGLAVGATSWNRPLDGLLVGALVGLWAIGVGGRRLRLSALAVLAAGTIASGAAIYFYNRALTGDGFTFPINAYIDQLYGPKANAYGFGEGRGLGWAFDPNPGSHSPADAIVNANLNTFGINTDLFGWSTGSLVLVALFRRSAGCRAPTG
jgi:hypothetical protein